MRISHWLADFMCHISRLWQAGRQAGKRKHCRSYSKADHRDFTSQEGRIGWRQIVFSQTGRQAGAQSEPQSSDPQPSDGGRQRSFSIVLDANSLPSRGLALPPNQELCLTSLVRAFAFGLHLLALAHFLMYI